MVAVRQHCLVAQKQSARPITGRPRSVTARDYQASQAPNRQDALSVLGAWVL